MGRISRQEVISGLDLGIQEKSTDRGCCLVILEEDANPSELFYTFWGQTHIMPNINFLHLTSCLLNSCYKFILPTLSNSPDLPRFPHPSKINQCLIEFYKALTGQEEIFDTPTPWEIYTEDPIPANNKSDSAFHESVMFSYEILALSEAVRFWLSPTSIRSMKNSPVATLLNPVQRFSYKRFNGFFYYRCNQLRMYPEFRDGKITTKYESLGILPLCWAEIWYALERKIRAGVCPYCGSVYLNSKYKSKAHCVQSECKKYYLREKNGPGWEAARKSLRDPSRKGIPGRPPSQKTLEDRKKALEAYKMEQDGCHVEYIAKKMKVSKSQVDKWLSNKNPSL